jgi:2-methylcitrate dehydratase
MDETTRALSRYITTFDVGALPASVVHQTKRTLIDTIGCALGGFHSEPARIARQLARGVSSATTSTLLGTAIASTPDLVAFANGATIRYLDFNDSYFAPGGGHPSDMIGALLAVADAYQCTGRRLLGAVAIAYEVFCRLSDQVNVIPLGWDQGTFSALGAVAGIAYLRGLDEVTTAQALAIASVSSLPLGATRAGELSMWKGCATASANRHAVFSTELAALGMSGPEAPFDGKGGLWTQMRSAPAQWPEVDHSHDGYRIMRTMFKQYPSQLHTQGPIELALELRELVSAQAVATVAVHSYEIAVSSAATEPQKWAPRTRETADHSIPFLFASAWLYGGVSAESFAEQRLSDPTIAAFMKKLSIDEDEEYTARYSDEFNCRALVTTAQGEQHLAHVQYPKGHAQNPFGDAELEGKFRALAQPVLGEEAAGRVLPLVWEIDAAPTLSKLRSAIVVPNMQLVD